MNDKKNLPLVKIAPYLCTAAFLLVLGIVIYCALTGNYEWTRFTGKGQAVVVQTYADPWESNELTGNYAGEAGKAQSIFFTVPKSVGNDYYVMFKSSYCRCELYDNDTLTLLGSYAVNKPHDFGEMTGNIRVLIPIPETFVGKTLRLDLTTYYTTSVDYPQITFGTLGTLKMRVFKENTSRLIICLVLLTLLVLALGVSIFEYSSGAKDITAMFLDFVGFVLCILTWMVCSSDMPQFFTNNNETVSLVSFLALAMLSIPFSAFCARVLTRGQKFFFINSKIGWILPVTIAVCYITDICDPFHILILTHAYIAITLGAAIGCSVIQCKDDRGAMILAISLLALAIFAITGFAFFYRSKTSGYDANIFGTGMAIFILMLFALLIHRQMGYYEKKKEAELYKYMAYTDFLTGIPNRSAYEDKIFELIQNYERRYVAFYIFDLNNLKLFNDQYGHMEGDKAIKATAECIKAAYSGKGDFFRLGGDEFAAIMINNENQLGACSAEFRHQLELYNEKAEHPIHVAVGWAEDYQDEDPVFFRKLFSKADGDMYAEKQRMKLMDVGSLN